MDLTTGIVLVIVGGALEGLFSLGVTRTRGWKWENIWGLGSLIALVLVPWPVALLTVPDLFGVFASVPPWLLVSTFLFGLGWGLGGIFWGKAIAAVGVALGVSLLMGMITIFGSPVPLAINEPAKLMEPGGLTLLAALGVMVVGVVLCAVAGARKDRELSVDAGSPAAQDPSIPFAVGLLFCLLSGVLSAMLNFGLVFGDPIRQAASPPEAPNPFAANAIWAIVFTGNYLVNAGYAFFLMFKNRTLGLISSEGTPTSWFWALFMGTAWPLGVVLFGVGAGKMGEYGAYVGFPMMLLVAILFANLAGALGGEWRGTSSRTRAVMFGGVTVLFVAFAVFSVANRLLAAS
jgi:L-rhamnose-H+ transport protein